MGELNDTHSTWYKICPELPFSLCANLIITFLFIVFLPLVITLGPLLWIIGATAFYLPYEIFRGGCHGSICLGIVKTIGALLCVLVVMPIAVALGMTAVAIADAFAILPLYYYSISYFVRLSIAACRTKL